MQFHFPLDRAWSMGSYIQENSLLKEKNATVFSYLLYSGSYIKKKKKSFSSLFKISPKLVIYRLGEQRVTTAVWQVKEWAVGSGGKGAEQLLLPAWCSRLLQEPARRTLPATGIAAGPPARLLAVRRVLPHSFQLLLLVFGLKA